MADHIMALHSHEGKQLDRLSNIISTIQTDHSITLQGLQRDLANAYKLISQLNDENEDLVQHLISLNRENTELMARLELETSRNGNLALQVKCLQKKPPKHELHQIVTLNHTQFLKHTHPIVQKFTKKTRMGPAKSATESRMCSQTIGSLGSLQNDQLSEPKPDKSGDKSCRPYGDKYSQGKVSPVLQARKISQSIPGDEAISHCIRSNNIFMKHQSFVACHSSTGSLMQRHHSFSTTLLSRTYSQGLGSTPFSTLNPVSKRNHSFCSIPRKYSQVSFAIGRHNSNANFKMYLPHSPLAIEPLQPVKNGACGNHSSGSKSSSYDASHDSVAPSRMQLTTDTWTASLSNSKLNLATERSSSSHKGLSNYANQSATFGNFHLNSVNDDTCLRSKPSCSRLIQRDWYSSLSSLPDNTFNQSEFGNTIEHLDCGTNKTSAVNSSLVPSGWRASFACETFERINLDCDEHLDFGSDDAGSAKSTADFKKRNFLKGMLGRSTQERRKSGTSLLVDFQSRRRSIKLRK